MAQVVVCDDCMKTNALTLASVIQVNISVQAPDGTERSIKGVVSACPVHCAPVEAVAEWLGQPGPQSTDPPPPPPKPIPAPDSQTSTAPYFECLDCGTRVYARQRSTHAQSRHRSARVAEVRWKALFDWEAEGYSRCECGYVTRGRAFTVHLNDYGHKADVGKHPLRSEDLDTATAKALLEGVKRL